MTPCSPTKRRILTEEGVFSPSKKSFSVPKLDLGVAKGSSSSHAASTPAADATSIGRASRRLSGQSQEPNMPLSRSPRSEMDFSASPSYKASAPNRPTRLYAPREMPPRMDSKSEHYPGFDVHQDTHILVPTRADLDATASAIAQFTKDEAKENAPVKKLKGAQKALMTCTTKEVQSPFISSPRRPDKDAKTIKTPRVVVSPPQASRPVFGTMSIKTGVEAATGLGLAKADRKKLMEAEAEGILPGESDSETDY